MDWIRENKTLAAILGVIIAGVAGLGYVLYTSWTGYTEAKDKYIGLGAQVAGIRGMALAPTEKNLQEKQAVVEEYATKVNQLSTALQLLQPVPSPITQEDFQKKLLARVKKTKEMAEALKVTISPDFAFGFGEYFGTLPKSDEIATELSGYLDGVEAIANLAITSKVVSIDLLDRTKLPSELDGAAATTAKKSSTKTAAPKAVAAAKKAIFDKNTVTLVATLDQGSLQLLLSRLANPADMKSEADPAKSHFTSIRLLRLENQARVGPPRRITNSINSTPASSEAPESVPAPAPASPASGEAKKEGEPSGPVEIKPPAPSAPDSAPIIGQEKLKVQMEIDLVKFLPSSPPAASNGVAPRP